MNKKCAECGNDFSCSNNISCWCSDFPKLSKNQIDENDCLCRSCLLTRYRKKILDIWHGLKIKHAKITEDTEVISHIVVETFSWCNNVFIVFRKIQYITKAIIKN